MSRGPGRIERAIRELLDANPDRAFVTDELCEHCYPEAERVSDQPKRAAAIEAAFVRKWGRLTPTGRLDATRAPGVLEFPRKYQVAVLRAARNVIKNDRDWQMLRMLNGQGGGAVFLNAGNARSYIHGQSLCWDYVSPKRARRVAHPRMRRRPEPELPPELRSTPEMRERWEADAKRYRDERHARWELQVRLHCATRDGFTVLADAMRARIQDARLPPPRMRCHADNGNGMATLNPTTLAARIRALMVQNDPDALRDGLAEIANELDGMAGY